MTHAVVLSLRAGTYSKGVCEDDEGASGYCTKKTRTETDGLSYTGNDAESCQDLIEREGESVDHQMLFDNCCLCGRAATSATSCSFCQAGKYNDQSTGTSSCASCASQSFHTCTKAADCEYEGCVHPERPARASADTTRCFTSSDYEIKGSNHDKDGNLLVAWRCYATPKDDPGDLWLCPAKDKVCLLLLPPVLSTLI